MLTRLTLVLAAAMIAAAPAAADTSKYQKIPTKGVTFKKKMGYWTECYYSGTGEVCTTVYARADNGKFKPAAVGATRLVKKQNQTMVCYWGSNNAEICYWAYSPRKAN